MLKIFEICFGTGAIFTVVSFLLGQVFHIGNTDMHVETNFDMSMDTHADFSIDSNASVTCLKPAVILSFITCFGGIGMICIKNGFSDIMAATISGLSAFTISFFIHRFIITPLYKAQNTSAVRQKEIKGNLGKLTLGINDDSFGKVNYSIGGNSYSSPAKSIDGKDIEKGSDVIIIDIKKNVFYVKKFYYEKISYRSNDD